MAISKALLLEGLRLHFTTSLPPPQSLCLEPIMSFFLSVEADLADPLHGHDSHSDSDLSYELDGFVVPDADVYPEEQKHKPVRRPRLRPRRNEDDDDDDDDDADDDGVQLFDD